MIRCISAAAISLALAGPARAGSADAEQLFEEGKQLLAKNRLAEACEAFEASERVEPGAGTLLYLGECRRRNHQLASAWSAYSEAVDRAKDPAKHRRAAHELAAIEPRLSHMTISVADDAQIDGLTITRNGTPVASSLWNRPVAVDGGDYTIIGTAPDHRRWLVSVHVDDERGQIDVTVPRLVALPRPPPEPPTPPLTTRRKLSLGLAGGSALTVAAGALLGKASRDDESHAQSLCANPAAMCVFAPTANDLRRTSYREALAADIAFGAAATAAVYAGVLWFTNGSTEDTSRLTVAPSVARGETSVLVVGRF